MRLFRKLILGIAGITVIGAASATVALAKPWNRDHNDRPGSPRDTF